MSRQVNKGDHVKVIANESGHGFIEQSLAVCTAPMWEKDEIAEFVGIDIDGTPAKYYMIDTDYKIIKRIDSA